MRRALAAVLAIATIASVTALAEARQPGAFEVPPARAAGVQRLIAPPAPCPSQGSAAGLLERQILCLVNFARAAAGRPPLLADPGLRIAAGHRDGDILDCDEFSHEACGREFVFWVE